MPGSEKFRVLVVDVSVGFGGATKSASLILKSLSSVDAHVLTSQDCDIRKTWYSNHPVTYSRGILNYRNRWRLARWLRQARIAQPDRVAGITFSAMEAVAFPFLLLRVLALGIINRTDIIHLQNGFYPVECLIAARMLKIPVIVHLRGFYPNDIPPKTYGACISIIGDSQAVLDSVPNSPEHGSRSVIYEPVDRTAFDSTRGERERVREKFGLKPSDVAVAIFGRIIPWKGQWEFIQAVLRAMDENPYIKAFLVGSPSDGDPSYLRTIRERVHQSPHAGRVVFVGYTPEVEPYYHAMDIVVHASTEPEPCGMVVLEGMAARRAVIAADAGGPSEIISHGEDGLLVPPCDVDALHNAIVQLASDSSRRGRIGEQAYAKIASRFTSTHAASQVLEHYHAVTSSKFARAVRTPVEEESPGTP